MRRRSRSSSGGYGEIERWKTKELVLGKKRGKQEKGGWNIGSRGRVRKRRKGAEHRTENFGIITEQRGGNREDQIGWRQRKRKGGFLLHPQGRKPSKRPRPGKVWKELGNAKRSRREER